MKNVQVENLHECIKETSDKISNTLAIVKPLVNDSASRFVKNDVKNLGLISQYNQMLEKTGVLTRKEAERFWCKNALRNNQIEEQHDRLLEMESNFDQFLESIDLQMKQEESVNNESKYLQEGDQFPGNVEVYDVENKKVKIEDYIPCAGNLIIIFLRHFA